jgi:hypothetical protein
MDLREIGWDSVDWIVLAQDRDRWRALVNTVMNYYRVLTMVYNTQRYWVFGLFPTLLFRKYPDDGQSPKTQYL